MQLQENGLPIGAEFVGIFSPKKGQYFVQEGDYEIATHDWGHYTKVIIKFATYGMPLDLVDLKGRKLLGGSVTTAYGRVGPGQTFINADGDVMKIPSNSCTTTAPFIRLEPLPKKRKVLVLELPIDEHGNVKVQDGPCASRASTFEAKDLRIYGGGTIKEVDDVA